MIPIDILDKIASWTGWSPISLFLVLVIGLLVYFSKEKISTIKLKVEAVESQKDILKEQIDILKNNSPDVLAKRYREEIDLLQDGIMLLSKDKANKEKEIIDLNKELIEKIREAENFKNQLEDAQIYLTEHDDILPREGRVDPQIMSFLVSEISIHSALFVPVERRLENKVDIEFKPPFRLMVKYPGMHKTILWIQDNESNPIGGIPNRFYTFYDRDYYETLINVLTLNPDNQYTPEDETGNPASILLTKSEHLGNSRTQSSTCYLKIPFDVSFLS